MTRLCCILLLLLGTAASGDAQVPEPERDSVFVEDSSAAGDTEAVTINRDTIMFVPEFDRLRDGRVSDTTDYEKRLTQQPTVALFKSLVLPGWGQIGNRKYVKAAVFAGFQVWFVSSAIRYGGEASDARRDWSDAVDSAERNRLYAIFDDKRGQRNKFTWFAAICSFVSMFDAYVDAHLSGSPEHRGADRVSFDVVPDGSGGAQATLSVTF